MRSDTAFFSAADIFRRFLSGLLSSGLFSSGLASGSLSVTAADAFLVEEDRRALDRAAGAEASRSLSTSLNALISA